MRQTLNQSKYPLITSGSDFVIFEEIEDKRGLKKGTQKTDNYKEGSCKEKVNNIHNIDWSVS